MACPNCTATSTEDLVAGSIFFCISSLGLVVSALIAVILIRHDTIARPFANLCVSLAAADCGVLAIFLCWSTPLTYTQTEGLSDSFLGRKIGHLSVFFWFASLYAMLALSVNRYVAIARYGKYKIWFNARGTRRAIGATWGLATLHSLLYFYPGCDVIFNPSWYLWHYAYSPCHNVMVMMDLGYGIMFIGLILILNLMTGLKIRAYNNQIAPTGIINKNEVIKRRRKELLFFAQSCVNAAVFEAMLLSFHVLSRFLEHKWSIFAATSLIWMVSHATNGFVLLAFNSDLRRDLSRMLCCRKANGPQPAIEMKISSKSKSRNQNKEAPEPLPPVEEKY